MTAAACAITFALLGLPTVLDVRLPMAEQAIEEQPAPQPATEPRAIDRISMAEAIHFVWSFPITLAAACMRLSHNTGLTLPGMMELPGWRSGSFTS